MQFFLVNWRKASYSGSQSNCVEVGVQHAPSEDALCLVRDSKDRNGPALAFTAAGWNAFTVSIKNGDLDS